MEDQIRYPPPSALISPRLLPRQPTKVDVLRVSTCYASSPAAYDRHYLHYGSKILQDGYSFAYQSHSSYFQLGLKHSLCLERRSPLKKVIYKSSLFSVHSPSASILIEAVRPLVTYTPSSAPYSAFQIIFGVGEKM